MLVAKLGDENEMANEVVVVVFDSPTEDKATMALELLLDFPDDFDSDDL